MAKNKRKRYRIYHIDDEQDFCEVFASQAKLKGIDVISSTSFEEFKEQLCTNSNIVCGVVLDIKCMIKKDQETASETFLLHAISQMDNLLKDTPIYILTANKELAQNEMFKGYTSYHKHEVEELLDVIRTKADDLPAQKLINNYSEVFEIFDKSYLEKSLYGDLFSLLNEMNSGDQTVIKDNLAKSRRLIEGLFQGLNKIDKELAPDSCFNIVNGKKELKFSKLHKHLEGNLYKNVHDEYIPDTEVFYSENCRHIAKTVYGASCDGGSHNPYDSPVYPPTKFTVISLANGLCDLFIWAVKILDDRQKPHE